MTVRRNAIYQIEEQGRKDDGADGKAPPKAPMHLIYWPAIIELAEVMGHGARKYGEKNYLKVEGWRYFSAAVRHLLAWWAGDKRDLDSGKSALAHVMACCIILMEKEKSDG